MGVCVCVNVAYYVGIEQLSAHNECIYIYSMFDKPGR